MNPEDKTRFKDLVQGVEPLPPGPRLVPTSPPSEPAVVVRPRASRSIELQEADGIWFAHASDASPRQALDLAKVPPDRQYRRLDLHRMSAARASVALDTAVRQARRDGELYLLVICGKGTHSGALGPTLSRLVVDELCASLADQIVAFRSAPPALGGQGAIIVRLRRRAR